MICRCEDVLYEDVVKAIREGFATIEEIKRHLRVGMGACQGRTCMRLIAHLISGETKTPVDTIKLPTVRPPLRPTPAEVLVGEGE